MNQSVRLAKCLSPLQIRPTGVIAPCPKLSILSHASIIAAFAQLERDTIVQRTRAGLDAARAHGRIGGRPSKVDARELTTIKKLVASGEHSRAEIASMTGISHATLYRVISSL